MKEGQDFLQEVLLSQGETFVIVIDENQMINLVWCSERLEIKYGFVFQTLMGHSFKEFFSNYIKGGYSDQIVEVFNNSKTLREEVEASAYRLGRLVQLSCRYTHVLVGRPGHRMYH